jgi:hypothetical protein
MSGLSEVSVLFSQRAGDIEKAREIFTAETRSFVSGVLAGIQRARSDPWIASRVRIDLPREIETESKTGYLSSQFAIARAQLRFKKGTKFTAIADVRFGIEFDQSTGGFIWQVSLVPAARYQRIDDLLWRHRCAHTDGNGLPGAVHQDRANTVRFVMRPVDGDFRPETAFNDVKSIFEFLITADAPLAEAVGLDPSPGDDE